MHDDAAFLRAIAEQPLDALPRLIYADYLDERGRSDAAAWLRADVRLAEAYPHGDPEDERAVKDLAPPEGVYSMRLAKSLGDLTRVMGAALLVLWRTHLGPAVRGLVGGRPRPGGGSVP